MIHDGHESSGLKITEALQFPLEVGIHAFLRPIEGIRDVPERPLVEAHPFRESLSVGGGNLPEVNRILPKTSGMCLPPVNSATPSFPGQLVVTRVHKITDPSDGRDADTF